MTLHQKDSMKTPRFSFLSLPRHVRDHVYRTVLVTSELLIFQESDARPVESFSTRKPAHLPGLLASNRRIHDEAKIVLYGTNCFNLVDTIQREVNIVRSFLANIGPVNAGLLSHLSISFPAVQKPGKESVTEDGMRTVQLLQENCTSLTTLDLYIHRREECSSLVEAREDGTQCIISEALRRIDTQLRAITTLNKVIVRSYLGQPTPFAKELMQGVGWVVLLGDKDQ